jgi:hypothetical protein
VQWNPLTRIDPDGMLDKEGRIKRRFERKYNRWINKNKDDLNGVGVATRHEMFRNSTTIFGKQRGDKNWFKKYEKITGTSPTTGWETKTDVTRKQIQTSVSNDGAGTGSQDQTYNIQANEGVLQISYDMYRISDRMQIFDAESGKKLFDTRIRVRGTGNRTVNFSLKDNNTNIRIVINKGRTTDERTQFTYTINVTGYLRKESAGIGRIDKSVPKP